MLVIDVCGPLLFMYVNKQSNLIPLLSSCFFYLSKVRSGQSVQRAHSEQAVVAHACHL